MFPFLNNTRVLAASLLEYDQMNVEIKMLSGYWIQDIADMLKAGWTLQPPEVPISMEQFAKQLEGEEDEE